MRIRADVGLTGSAAAMPEMRTVSTRALSATRRVLAALTLFSIPAPTEATDAALVGSCLLQNCQKQLAGCLSDVKCLKNLACLQKCNGLPDEQACQIRCGPIE